MKKKISGIIIDDEPDIVEVFSDYFELNDIDILGRGFNGCNAAKLYEEKKPDFVLLDMKMPKYDGRYAIKKIKEIDPNANIFVVTGFSDYLFNEGEVKSVFTKSESIQKIKEKIIETIN